MTFRPNWQTYKVEVQRSGLRRYLARSTYVAVNGNVSQQHLSFTRRGAEKWITDLRVRQTG